MKRTMGLILLVCMLLTCFMQCTVSAEVGKVEKIGSLPGAYTRKVMAQIENFNYILPEETEKDLVPLIGTYLHPEKAYTPYEIRLSSPAQIIRGQENGKTLDLVMNENVFINPDEYEAGIEEWEITGSEEISIEKVEKVDDRHLKLTLKGNSSSANGTLKIGVRFPRDYVTFEKALYPSDAPGAQGEQDERYKLDEAGVILSKYVSDNTVTIKEVMKPNIHISGGGSASISVPKVAPASGEVLKGSKVELTTTSSGAEIRYTTDGTTPDKNSALYSDGIVIEKDMTVKAIAIAGSRKSGVLTAHYTVREPKMQLKENIQSIRYIKGYSDNCFKADQAITRYEVLEALDHLLEIEEIKEAHTFKDVESRYADLVSRFAGVGIIDGYTDQTFGGNRGITRAELIKILCIPWKIESVKKDTERFSDIGAHWAKGVIAAFTDRGYLKGYEDGTFRPDSEITRAEFVTLMNRVIGIKTQVRTHQFDDLTESYWAYEDIQKAYIFE